MKKSFKDKIFGKLANAITPKLVNNLKEEYRQEAYTEVKNELDTAYDNMQKYQERNSILAKQNQELKRIFDLKQAKEKTQEQVLDNGISKKEEDYSKLFD